MLPSVASAQGASGFGEVRGSWSAGVDGVSWQLVERVRPTFTAELRDRLHLTGTAELALVQGRNLQDELERTLDESDLGPLLSAFCTWPSDVNETFDISQAGDYLSVDRLYLDAYLPVFDLRVGRQPVQWGSGLMMNPTDPFPEVLFNEPWKPRRGVNAARMTVPIGDKHQFQAVVGIDDRFRRMRGAVRATANVARTDISLVGAYRQEGNHSLVGLDIKGTLGVGFWFEGALHVGDSLYEELSVGVDYSVPVLDNIVVAAQYYRNGSGASDPSDYAQGGTLARTIDLPDCTGVDVADELGMDPHPDPFAPFTMAQNYLLLMARFGVVPELAITFTGLQNLDDGTGFLVPVLTTRPTGWLEVSLAAQVPYRAWGAGGEFRPSAAMTSFSGSPVDGVPPLDLDLGGLIPDATFTLWTRAAF